MTGRMPMPGQSESYRKTLEMNYSPSVSGDVRNQQTHGNMIQIIRTIHQIIKRRIYAAKVKKAIGIATGLSKKDGRKYIVLYVKGSPRVYAKADLQLMIKQRVFKKGTCIQDLEKRALFITK
jgi:hypothetical protein